MHVHFTLDEEKKNEFKKTLQTIETDILTTYNFFLFFVFPFHTALGFMSPTHARIKCIKKVKLSEHTR